MFRMCAGVKAEFLKEIESYIFGSFFDPEFPLKLQQRIRFTLEVFPE